jgi:hypothetical protein
MESPLSVPCSQDPHSKDEVPVSKAASFVVQTTPAPKKKREVVEYQ